MPGDGDLGIGFVGTGFVTKTFHAESLRGIRHAHAAGVMNRTRSKAVDLAGRLRELECGDPTVHDTVESLVRDPDVDAIWLTSPNHVRVETVERIVSLVDAGEAELAGIAIEKPLARNLAEGRRVVDLVESVGISHAYLENQVYMPAIVGMKDRLWKAGGQQHRPYLARAAEEHAGPHSAWFWDGERQGGGVLNDMMCHSHKVNNFLLESTVGDSLTPVAVSCDLSTLKWTRDEYADELLDEYGVDYRAAPSEDYARATVYYRTPGGQIVVGEATNSWCYVGSGLRMTVELLGPEYSGSINTLDAGLEVFLSSDVPGETGYMLEKQQSEEGAIPVIPDEVTTYGYLAQNRHVIDAFRCGEHAREDLHDGLAVLRLCMASYKAAETGERMSLESVDLTDYVPAPARGDFEPAVPAQ